MFTIVIIGSGNVAQHLISAFTKADDCMLVQVFARDKNSISHLIEPNKITANYNDLKPASVYIVAVSDHAIAAVSNQLPCTNQLVVHTSGGVPIDVLSNNNRKGVFYPLQSFTKNKTVNFTEIPICLEAQNAQDYSLLEKIAATISAKIFNVNSVQRKSLHVSAVFVNNFVNHLYQIAYDICKDHTVDFEILKPLILETANKVMEISPMVAQTGPAKRNDTLVINNHLDFLVDENQQQIYKILTQSIQQYGKEL